MDMTYISGVLKDVLPEEWLLLNEEGEIDFSLLSMIHPEAEELIRQTLEDIINSYFEGSLEFNKQLKKCKTPQEVIDLRIRRVCAVVRF